MKKLIVSVLALALLAGCGAKADKKGDDKVIRIGASVTPHAEIIRHIEPKLKEMGYTVDLKEFSDYIQPNVALAAGDLDANFFQHKPFMDDWAKKAHETGKITSVLPVIFGPIGIYSTKHKSLSEIADNQKISVPNDPTNEGRALNLLADNGIITLKKGKGVDATKSDIEKYNKKVDILEMQAETCATTIKDVDFAVVNDNNALNAKITDKVIVTESKDSDAAKTYANIIAVQTAHKDDPKIKALVKALNTEDVKNFCEQKYKGNVIALVPTK